MKIKYIGVKEDGETAFSRETGITWFPGAVEDVLTAVAAKMLQHPDVFARDDEVSTAAAVTLRPPAPTAPAPIAVVMEPGSLMGSDVLPALVDIGGQKVQLGTIVASAHTRSGLTVEDWNALAPAVREELLATEIEVLTNASAVAAETVIQLADGTQQVLDGKTREQLQALAKELGVKVHVNAGMAKVTEALLAAFPVTK